MGRFLADSLDITRMGNFRELVVVFTVMCYIVISGQQLLGRAIMTQHRGLRRWFRTTSVALSTGLLIAVVSVGLTACGYNANQGSISSTQSPAQVIDSQPQVTHSQVQAQVQVQKCGVVQGLGSLKVPVADTGAEQAETCFWQAFQHCHPATLIFIRSGLGAALIRTFTLHTNHGSCSISDAKQQRVAPNPPSAAKIYTCTGLVKLPGALRFTACGQDGDVFVAG